MQINDLGFEGFNRRPSKLELERIVAGRSWLLEHANTISASSERNQEILTLRFGLRDDVIRSLSHIAGLFELQAHSMPDIIAAAMADLRHADVE